MTEERERSWRAAGERARQALMSTAKPTAEVVVLRDAAERFAVAGAGAERLTRASRCRRLADEVRALERRVEAETRVDATKLRAFAIHLENRADMLEGKPL